MCWPPVKGGAKLVAFADAVEAAAVARGWIKQPQADPSQKEAEAPETAEVTDEAEDNELEVDPGVVPRRRTAEVVPYSSALTYAHDGDFCFFRHPPERPCAWEVVLNVGDAVSNLKLKTPDGCHATAEIELRALRHGWMQPVLSVRGQATPDGRLQVIVTNVLTGNNHVIDL